MARLETKVNELHEIWRENRIREYEREKLAQLEREKKLRKQKELDDFKGLLNRSLRWQQVKVLREFIADARDQAVRSNTVTEEFLIWVDWATKKANWYDPCLEAEDPLLLEVDRESLTMLP